MSKLTPPVGPHDHAQGSPEARITLVEYGDYECPHCGAAYPIVKQIQEELGDDLRFVFRNFPLSETHPHALRAAQAAEAAALQGRFWEMHDTLFENQQRLGEVQLHRYAGAIGLDVQRFVLDLDSEAVAARVRSDFLSGVRGGVNGTPTFFVNGARYDRSWDHDALLASLEELL